MTQRILASSVGASAFVRVNNPVGGRGNFVTLFPDGLGPGGDPGTPECMADDAGSYTYDDTGTDCTQAG